MSVITNIVNIVLYRFTGDFVSNRSDKISIFPEFSAPQLSLYLWMSQKDLFCTHSFQKSHHLNNRIFGWYRCKYMYMIFCYFHLLYFTVSCFQYLFNELLYSISKLFFPYPLGIFRCPHKMVSFALDCMAHSFEAHAVYYTKLPKKGIPLLPVIPHGASRVGFS